MIISTDTLNSRHDCSLHTRASGTVLIVLTDNLDSVQFGKHDAGLVHVVNILLQNSGILNDFFDRVKPVRGLIIDIETIPV
jgi:hypothetical protein